MNEKTIMEKVLEGFAKFGYRGEAHDTREEVTPEDLRDYLEAVAVAVDRDLCAARCLVNQAAPGCPPSRPEDFHSVMDVACSLQTLAERVPVLAEIGENVAAKLERMDPPRPVPVAFRERAAG